MTRYAALLAALLLVACSKPPAPAPVQRFQPSASIQDLMASIVDPSADALWEAVSSEVTAKGVEEKQPHSEEEWQAVRRHAIALVEAGNLLQIHGRAVAHAGRVTEDAHVEGVSGPAQVQAAIDSRRADFDAAARGLHDSAAEALAAIDRKDPGQLVKAGARIDQACEHCHSTFWYPNAKTPGWPAKLGAPAR